MKFKCTEIDWDTDGEQVDLPSELIVDVLGEEIDQAVSDAVSDATGFCHFGFTFRPFFEDETDTEDETGADGLWDKAGEIAVAVGLYVKANPPKDDIVYAEEWGQEIIFNALKRLKGGTK